jgi:hypothetical protein
VQDIDVLSTQQQAFDQEEAEINREIEAINNSIHLVSEHTFAKKKEDPAYRSRIPYAPDGGTLVPYWVIPSAMLVEIAHCICQPSESGATSS